MKRLTVAGRLLITALVLGAIFVGYKYFGGQKALDQIAQDQAKNAQTEASTNEANATANTAATDSEATDTPASLPFQYTSPAPVDGKLKGVVELGASGFNSFIIKVDKQKRWSLEKSEFGKTMDGLRNSTGKDLIQENANIGELKKYLMQINNIKFNFNKKD